MRNGADRIRQIVLSLRNFARLDEAELKPVKLREGLDSSLELLSQRLYQPASTPSIAVHKLYASDLPEVECYPGLLNQAIFNLLTNAIDAIEARLEADANFSPVLELRTALVPAANGVPQAEIRITDNGVPFPEEVERRIFEPFVTTKPIGQGVGLGLAESYSIATDRHGGILQLERHDASKSFVLRIPTVQPRRQQPQDESPDRAVLMPT